MSTIVGSKIKGILLVDVDVEVNRENHSNSFLQSVFGEIQVTKEKL